MQAAVIALYLFQKFQSGMHSATLEQQRAALKWFQWFFPSGVANPLDDALGLNILEQVKRCWRKPIAKKTLLTTDIIKKLIHQFAHAQASLKDLRIATFCTLCFAGFFRFVKLYVYMIIISYLWNRVRRFSYLAVRPMFIAKAIICLLRSPILPSQSIGEIYEEGKDRPSLLIAHLLPTRQNQTELYVERSRDRGGGGGGQWGLQPPQMIYHLLVKRIVFTSKGLNFLAIYDNGFTDFFL